MRGCASSGNELSGEIAEVGPSVSHLRPGDKVICIAGSGNDGIAQEIVTLGEVSFLDFRRF